MIKVYFVLGRQGSKPGDQANKSNERLGFWGGWFMFLQESGKKSLNRQTGLTNAAKLGNAH